MKILLDECVPWPMHTLLLGHSCVTVRQRGWQGVKNGELLRRASGEFDLFIPSDQNIRYQQNSAGQSIAILELSANKRHQITAATPLIRTAIAAIRPAEFKYLEIP